MLHKLANKRYYYTMIIMCMKNGSDWIGISGNLFAFLKLKQVRLF